MRKINLITAHGKTWLPRYIIYATRTYNIVYLQMTFLYVYEYIHPSQETVSLADARTSMTREWNSYETMDEKLTARTYKV